MIEFDSVSVLIVNTYIYQRIVICGFSRSYLFGTHERNLINWITGDFSWTGGKRVGASNFFSFDEVIESCILRHYDLYLKPSFLENKALSLQSQWWLYKTMMKETTEGENDRGKVIIAHVTNRDRQPPKREQRPTRNLFFATYYSGCHQTQGLIWFFG